MKREREGAVGIFGRVVLFFLENGSYLYGDHVLSRGKETQGKRRDRHPGKVVGQGHRDVVLCGLGSERKVENCSQGIPSSNVHTPCPTSEQERV